MAEVSLGYPATRVPDGEAFEEIIVRCSNMWAVRVFVAVCNRYNLRTFRHPRQGQTTLVVVAPPTFFDNVVSEQYVAAHSDMVGCFDAVMDWLINDRI